MKPDGTGSRQESATFLSLLEVKSRLNRKPNLLSAQAVSSSFDLIAVFHGIQSSTAEVIDPDTLEIAYVSPRVRSKKTFELMCAHLPELPRHVITEQAREWDYG